MRVPTPLALLATACAALTAACDGAGDTPTGDTGPDEPQPVEVVDLLPQTLHDPVDILFVLDASWTEGVEALDEPVLNNAFETLLLADPAWRMALLDPTATGSKFGLMGPKIETWPYPKNVFQPPPASASPKIREVIYTALELRREQDANSGFLRAEGALYILVFTGKRDATDDLADGITKQKFENWLEDFDRSGSVRLGVFTAAQHQDYWSDRTFGGGIVRVGAFRKGLEELFRDAIGQKTVFTLTHTPTEVPTKVDVIYREHRTEYFVEQDFLYDPESRTISFIDVVPRVDSVVRVIYETLDPVAVEASGTATEPTTAATGG